MNGPIESTSLPSRVLLETSQELPLVSLSVGTKRGGVFDPPGCEGLTRLVARLMRRTAGEKEPLELDARIDSIGASFSVEASASSVVFHTTTIRRSLPELVEIVTGALSRPGLIAAEFERLKRETEAELTDALDDDRGLARRWFRKRLFGEHPYGRPLSGTPESLAKLTIEDAAQQARSLATRGQLFFAFAGDIQRPDAEAIARAIEDTLPDGAPFLDPTPEPNPIQGRRVVLVDKPDRTQTQILIGSLGSLPTDPDHLPLLVGNTIFGGTFTARMTQEIRAKRGWSYGAYSNLTVDRRRQDFSLWTFPKSEDATPCIQVQLQMLDALRVRGVTKKELASAKRYLIRSHAFAIDTASKRVGLKLDASLHELPAGYYEDYRARIARVTLDQVNQALTQRIPKEDLLIVVVGTAADLQQALEAGIPGITELEVVPYDRAV